MSQSIKDKVINHLVSFCFLVSVFDKTLINSNIATIIGKGTHYGLRLFRNYYNYLKNKYHIELPIYKKGKGLPIGNMSSQVIACFYLDELEKFIINDLGIKHYIRYMDDGVLFHYDKNCLKYCLIEIEKIVH